jgi:putative hemolysin
MKADHGMAAPSMVLEGSGSRSYPAFPEFAPDQTFETSHYRVRFAGDRRDLEAVQRLRYGVFNIELREGLDGSHASERDEDAFDSGCHHLMVVSKADDRVIGTYRMQTCDMADAGRGFYCDTLFDLRDLPADVRRRSVETGRACIAADHRNGRVLSLLWRGLAQYMKHNRMRYLFGCSSLTSQDPQEGLTVYDWLARQGHLHARIRLEPRPGHLCVIDGSIVCPNPPARAPQLLRLYLEYGAKVCGSPAMDRDFKTIDFFTLLDVEQFDPRLRQRFFG